MATSTFGVTAAMVKRIVRTTMSDADVEEEAELQEKMIRVRTGQNSAPSDDAKLGILQQIVVKETAIQIRTKDPHSQADGSYRQEHYPQLIWNMELKALYDHFRPHVTKSTDYQTDDIKKSWNE